MTALIVAYEMKEFNISLAFTADRLDPSVNDQTYHLTGAKTYPSLVFKRNWLQMWRKHLFLINLEISDDWFVPKTRTNIHLPHEETPEW